MSGGQRLLGGDRNRGWTAERGLFEVGVESGSNGWREGKMG